MKPLNSHDHRVKFTLNVPGGDGCAPFTVLTVCVEATLVEVEGVTVSSIGVDVSLLTLSGFLSSSSSSIINTSCAGPVDPVDFPFDSHVEHIHFPCW